MYSFVYYIFIFGFSGYQHIFKKSSNELLYTTQYVLLNNALPLPFFDFINIVLMHFCV